MHTLYKTYALRPLRLAIALEPYLRPRIDGSSGRIEKIYSSVDSSWQTIAKNFYAKFQSCGRNARKFNKFVTMTHNTVCIYLILIYLKTFVCADSAPEDDGCSHLEVTPF